MCRGAPVADRTGGPGAPHHQRRRVAAGSAETVGTAVRLTGAPTAMLVLIAESAQRCFGWLCVPPLLDWSVPHLSGRCRTCASLVPRLVPRCSRTRTRFSGHQAPDDS